MTRAIWVRVLRGGYYYEKIECEVVRRQGATWAELRSQYGNCVARALRLSGLHRPRQRDKRGRCRRCRILLSEQGPAMRRVDGVCVRMDVENPEPGAICDQCVVERHGG